MMMATITGSFEAAKAAMIARMRREDRGEAEPEPTAKAREADPETSREAASSVEYIRESQQAILNLFYMKEAHGFAKENPARISDEEIRLLYAHHYKSRPQSESGLRTRRSELVRQGKLRASGEFGKTKSGRKTIKWELTR